LQKDDITGGTEYLDPETALRLFPQEFNDYDLFERTGIRDPYDLCPCSHFRRLMAAVAIKPFLNVFVRSEGVINKWSPSDLLTVHRS